MVDDEVGDDVAAPGQRREVVPTAEPFVDGEVVVGVEPGVGSQRGKRGAAAIHVRLGFDQAGCPAGNAGAGFTRPARAREWACPPAHRKVIHQQEPGVMPGAAVLRARVAQADDREQGSGLFPGFLFIPLGLADELRLVGRDGLDHRRGRFLSPGRDHRGHGEVTILQHFGASHDNVPNVE